jgi:hypothetical protein
MGQQVNDVRAPWWETPRRSAVRAVCWLAALAWASAAAWRLTFSELEEIGAGVSTTCSPNVPPMLLQLGVAGVGIGLIVYSLNVPPRSVGARALVVVGVAVIWVVIAFLWLPNAPHSCEN